MLSWVCSVFLEQLTDPGTGPWKYSFQIGHSFVLSMAVSIESRDHPKIEHEMHALAYRCFCLLPYYFISKRKSSSHWHAECKMQIWFRQMHRAYSLVMVGELNNRGEVTHKNVTTSSAPLLLLSSCTGEIPSMVAFAPELPEVTWASTPTLLWPYRRGPLRCSRCQ